MKLHGKLLLPGDKGFKEGEDANRHWNRLRTAARLPVINGARTEVDGFFIVDYRQIPPVAIFKNCSFSWKVGNVPASATNSDEIKPFVSIRECILAKEAMHLSNFDDKRVRITAMARDPGLGGAMPDTMWVDGKDLKE